MDTVYRYRIFLVPLCCALFLSFSLHVLFAIPSEAASRVYVNDGINEYRDWLTRSSSFRKKVQNLDDDPVRTFHIPVLFGVALDDITENFGDPRGGGTRLHEGLDMLAPLGTPIVSPTDAVVMKTGDGPSSGLVVYTANPGGETFVYMHLDEIADIESGDVLRAGDIIGYMGDTGNANGISHLHFEVRDDRDATDPYPRIQKEYSLEEKMEILEGIFDSESGDSALAAFLVETYSGVFMLADRQGIDLPTPIVRAMEKQGVEGSLDGITRTLRNGMEGSDVAALQVYLISLRIGSAARTLATTGATGYFGSVTEAALLEYQESVGERATGVFVPGTMTDSDTTKSVQQKEDAAGGYRDTTAPSLRVVADVLVDPLEVGDEGVMVQILQLYLIIKMSGQGALALLEAGPTGYFGPVTRAALTEYQTKHGLDATGMYGPGVRTHIAENG